MSYAVLTNQRKEVGKVPIVISGKKFKEIIITDNNDNLLAMITDKGEIISEESVKVKCIPV